MLKGCNIPIAFLWRAISAKRIAAIAARTLPRGLCNAIVRIFAFRYSLLCQMHKTAYSPTVAVCAQQQRHHLMHPSETAGTSHRRLTLIPAAATA
jgi:hypothetical protein